MFLLVLPVPPFWIPSGTWISLDIGDVVGDDVVDDDDELEGV